MFNLLPYDGKALYFKDFFTPEESLSYFETLLNQLDWQSIEVQIFW